MTNCIKIIQHDICKGRIASLQLKDYCSNNDIDIVLLQEPLIQQKKVYAFECDKQAHKGDNAGAAIIILNGDSRTIELAQHTSDFIVEVRVSRHGGVGVF